MSVLLEIKGLRGGYLSGVDTLRGIDLTVQAGETVGIIGLNGSGKSTLGKAVLNLIPFRTGEIRFDGKPIEQLETSDLARNGLAIMQQGGQVFPNLSLWDNLRLAFHECNDEQYSALLASMIPLLAAPRKILRGKMADKLSGGQRHQLALAMALARHPRLVVLDEPSAGLSPKAVDDMYALLKEVRQSVGVTLLIIEQNISKAVNFCDRCLLLEQGRVIKETYDKNIQQFESLMLKK